MAEVNGLAGMPSEACRGAQVRRDPCSPDKAGLHADPGLQHEDLFVRAVLQRPSEPGADPLGRTPTGLLEEKPQITFPARKVIEPHERRKLPEKRQGCGGWHRHGA